MLKKLASALFIIVIMAFAIAPAPVWAQSATNEAWSSSITYYTPSTTAGELIITYYDGTTSYSAGPFTLAAHAAGSVSISTTDTPDGFIGSAVLSADVPIYATYVQFSKDNDLQYSRSFYSGFDASDAGATFYIATVRAVSTATTRIAVQNVDNYEIIATLDFYAVGATTPTFSYDATIAPNAAYSALVTEVPNYPGGTFNGSMVVSAVSSADSGVDGHVVASALETENAGRGAVAFEGSAAGSTTVYMASAMCQRGGSSQTSYYAIQNTGASTASVTVDYYNTSGTKVGSMPATDIAAGAKISVNPCTNNLLVGALGSAVINSDQPIIAIGKVASNDGLLTAFVGESEGSLSLAAPYVRWTSDVNNKYVSNIAVMNVGSSAATNIVAKYYDASGTLRATVNLATAGSPLNPYTKVNTNPNTAGALVSGVFGYSPNGGAVEITSDQPIIATVRLSLSPLNLGSTTTLGEDYNAVSISSD